MAEHTNSAQTSSTLDNSTMSCPALGPVHEPQTPTPPGRDFLACLPARTAVKRLVFTPGDGPVTPRRTLKTVRAVRSPGSKQSLPAPSQGWSLDADADVGVPRALGLALQSSISCEDSGPTIIATGAIAETGSLAGGSTSDLGALASTSDEDVVLREPRRRNVRVIQSESELETEPPIASTSSAYSAPTSSAAPGDDVDVVSSDFESESAVLRAGRRRRRRLIILDSDEEDEDQISGDAGRVPADAKGVAGRRSSPHASGPADDLLDVINRLYINDSDWDDVEVTKPVVKPRGNPRAAKEIIVISSDDEDPVEPEGLDDYLLRYSPSPETRPVDLPTTPLPTPRGTAKTPTIKGTRTKKAWASERVLIAETLFDELDREVFKCRLREAGAKLEWNTRLLTTAGTATDKSKRLPNGEKEHEYVIKLSTKVLDEPERVLSTVAHEMCHLACWIINNEYRNPHGRVFQSWGRRVMRARPEIEVTTRHDYEIAYKYSWQCTRAGCGKVYKRQSKSIDIDRHACGKCSSRLAPMFATKATSAFQDYLKVNMKHAKAALPSATFGELMRELSSRWKSGGEGHEAYWMARASAE